MDLTGLICDLNAAPHGSKREIIKRYAMINNTGMASVYRALNSVRGKTKNVKREPKVEDALIDEVAKLKLKGMINGVSFRELSTELCIQILQDTNYPGAENLTVTTVNRRLAERGFRVKDPIVRVEAQYSNQQHQMDFSRSKYFQLFRYEKDEFILKATTKNLSYKENDIKQRLWLSAITDAYSRISLARAFPASGESVLMGIEFLNFAFNREEDSHHLKYIPETLKTDNGAFAKNGSVKGLLDKLEIKNELVQPYKKHGIQKVESLWRTIWQRFELRNYIILGEGKTITLSDYNDLLHQFMVELMAMKHPMKMETREHVYLSSLAANPPRKIEVDLREVIAKPWIRTVRDDCTISIENQKYQCSPKYIGMQIRAWKNLSGEIIGELVDEYTKPFALTATDGFVHVGDFEHRHSASYKQQIETTLKHTSNDHSIAPSEVSVHPAETSIKKVHYLQPTVSTVRVETKFDEVFEHDNNFSFPNEFKARLYIAERLGRTETYSKYASVFDPLLKQTLSRHEIDALLETVRAQKAAL